MVDPAVRWRRLGTAPSLDTRPGRWEPVLVAVALAAILLGCTVSDSGEPQKDLGGATKEGVGRTGGPAEGPTGGGDRGAGGPRLVWVGVEGAGRVVLVDLDTGKVVASHDVPDGPHNVTVLPDGTGVAALPSAGALSVMDQRTARVVELGGRPHDVKPFPGGIVVANEGANRIELLTAAGEQSATVTLPSPPHDVAVSPDGRSAWATLDGSDDLVVVDLEAGSVARTVSTGRRPHDLLFSPEGRLWVTDWAGAVHVFSPDGTLVASEPLGKEAHHLAFSPSGDRVWIADHATRELFVLDTQSVQVLQRISLPGSPHHVAVTPDGELVAVADHDNGTLLVLTAQSGEEVSRIAVGAQPHGVWAVPAP